MERIAIEQALPSGSEVGFVVSGYMIEPNESKRFVMTVPKYPRRIDKATITYTGGATVWQWPTQSASTGSYTASAYWFLDRTGDQDYLDLQIKLTPSSSVQFVVVGDNLTFQFADPGISHLNGLERQVSFTHMANRNIKFIIPKSTASPRVGGDYDTTLTGVNKVIEGRQFVIGKEYKVDIVDKAVTENLEYGEFIRQIPIFAFTQSASINKPAPDTKYVMAPGTIAKGNGNAVAISDTSTPNMSTALLFAKKSSNTSVITQMNDNGGYVRFYVAIAEYTRKTENSSWTGKWLQVLDGKPIWKEVPRAK